MMRVLQTACVALLVPAAWVSAVGGLDLDLGPHRVSWYAHPEIALALLGGLLCLLLPDWNDSQHRVGRAVALLGLLACVCVVWTGGFALPAFSMRSVDRPTLLIWVGLALSLVRKPSQWGGVASGLVRSAGQIMLALLIGVGLKFAVDGLDRDDMSRRLAAERPALAAPDILMILVDTLRADALGVYGASTGASPYLDEWAAKSVVFERAISQSPWTAPSVASLMTSLHPSTLDPKNKGRRWNRASEWHELPDSFPRLATRLRDAGYGTAAFIKNSLIASDPNHAAGFDIYEEVGGDRAELESAAQLVNAALRFGRLVAERRSAGEAAPYFLYLHFLDPHIDYLPPEAFRPTTDYQGPVDGRAHSVHELVRAIPKGGGPSPEDVEQMRQLYAGEVRYLDGELRRLEAGLSELDVWNDSTVAVLVSDHGEQFGEHGSFEHEDLHIENVHIPLWIQAEGFAPHRVQQVVRMIDVAPTLLELAGLEPLEAEGRSLVPMFRGQRIPPLPAFSEFGRKTRVTSERFSIIDEGKQVELFDLRADPQEQRELSQLRPGPIRKLRDELDDHQRRRRNPLGGPAVPLPAETLKALEELGYIRKK